MIRCIYLSWLLPTLSVLLIGCNSHGSTRSVSEGPASTANSTPDPGELGKNGDGDEVGVDIYQRLREGNSYTRLFENIDDERAQVGVFREESVSGNDVSEREPLYDICHAVKDTYPAIYCEGLDGYIMHLSLTPPMSSKREDLAIDYFGYRWTKLFHRFHRSRHCALVILGISDMNENATENDEMGNRIVKMKCFR